MNNITKKFTIQCPHCGTLDTLNILVTSEEVSKQVRFVCNECESNIMLEVNLSKGIVVKE